MNKEFLLRKLDLPDFVPLPLLSSGFLQSVAGTYWPQRPDDGLAELKQISLGEGDFTVAAVDRPLAWKPGDRVLLLIHGLTGDHLSSYMVRLSQRFRDDGFLVVRMNLRNAGAAFGLSRKTYHGGITDDVRTILRWIAVEYPNSPVTAIGYSLSGNLLLKMAAEDGDSPTGNLARIATVSPAVDLAQASRKLEEFPGSLIANFFLKLLLKDLARLQVMFPAELHPLKFPEKLTIRGFDDVHNSAYHGFQGADDYYFKCSSINHLSFIEVPTLIIGSIDDPVVDISGVQESLLPPHIESVITDHGGHAGYIGFADNVLETRWSDVVISRWVSCAS